MRHVTDKYHLLSSDGDEIQLPGDIKDVSKRGYQLGIAILFTGICLSAYDAFIGMYVSSFLLGCFCFSILMFIILKYNQAISNLPVFIISMICGLLVTSVLFEGLQSEQYLLFFPTLIAVPIIIDLKETSYRRSFIYIAIILVSFGICILIGHVSQPFETFNAEQILKLSFVNRIIAIFSTILFAVSYIFFEKKYIAQLVEKSQQAINTRTRFLATMGHELRTPLNGIIGTINLLKQGLEKGKYDEYMEILKYCSDHMLQQVNDILDFNKIEDGKLEVHEVAVNLGRLLNGLGMPFKSKLQEKNLDLIMEVDEQLNVFVLADDLRLIQVFNNLFSNALKFTEEGFIKLIALCKSVTEDQITVSFEVEDTGIGIDKEDQQMIFQSFRQVYNENTKKQLGTGLGLTIAVRLLKLMNSDLKLESQKGKGSKFLFEIVFKRTTLTEPISHSSNSSNDLAGVRLLLVEDNPINLMVAKRALLNFNATVITAVNGQEALEMLTTKSGFDMVLMDLEMPVMNGYQAIYKVKVIYPSLKVIAFTASLVDQQMLSDLIESGFVDCILKPFKQQELLAKIKGHLNIY